MGKKDKEKKKLTAKQQKYLKFRREKPGTLDLKMPDLDEEVVKQRREDETSVERFWRYRAKMPEKYVNERKALSKR